MGVMLGRHLYGCGGEWERVKEGGLRYMTSCTWPHTL